MARYVGLVNAAGLDWDTVQSWTEHQVAGVLLPRTPEAQAFIKPDWGRIYRELDRKGMTLMLLCQEYVAAHPEGRIWCYTQLQRALQGLPPHPQALNAPTPACR